MLVLNIGFGAAVTSTSSVEEMEKTIIFSKPIIKTHNEYVTIEIDEADSYLINENRPLLPSYTHTFTFPIGTNIISVNCQRKNIDTKTLSKNIMPSPAKMQLTTLKQTSINQDYNDEIYPEICYDYNVGSGITKNNERNVILKVTIYPVKYDPSQNIIEYAKNMEINVKYDTSADNNFNDDYPFVIITAPGFTNQLNNLVTHKINRGLDTKLVTLNEIYSSTYFPVQGRDDAEKVKYFIKNCIENWGTTDVMIVGDRNDFPTRDTHIKVSDDDDEIFVSDLYFADIYNEDEEFCSWDSNNNDVFAEYDWGSQSNYDEIDAYPDVRIGRLACTSSSQVTAVVNKIINYETQKSYTKNWFNEIVVIGGDTAPNDEENIDEGEYLNQAVLNVMNGFIPTKIWDSNGKLGGIINTGVKNINDAINDGCGFVCWSGHGAPTVWTTFPHNGRIQSLPTPFPPGVYYNYYNSNLENGDKLPIVTCGGCSLGKFQSNENCFAWAYLANPDGGAIATIGAAGLGYVYLGSYVTRGLVEGFMLDVFEAYDDGAVTFGEMWSWAIDDYITGRLDGGDYKTLTELIPFGDPTLRVREETQAPLKPSPPQGPSQGSPGSTLTYSAVTTDPDGDQISYLFDWGDGTYSDWIGPKNSGVSVSATKSWDEKGTYQIRVLAKDIHGKTSEWSEPMPIQMPYNNDYDDSNLKPGTIFSKWTGENGLHLPALLGDLIIFIQHDIIVTCQIEDIDEAEFILYNTIGDIVDSEIITSSNEIYSYNFGRPGIGFYKITIKGIKNNDIVSTTNFESILSLST